MDTNPTKASPGWPPVVVAGAFQTGVILMRNLERRGVRAFAVDANPGQPGFTSVYGKTFLCPNPDTEPDAWLAFMIDLSRQVSAEPGAKPALIPSADQFVSAIARFADALGAHYVFCQSAMATQALLATKKRQYEIADAHGLSVPRTQFVDSPEQIARFAAIARFPVLIKPVHFREWERIPGHPLYGLKLTLADNAEQLAAQYALAAQMSPEAVLQEIIEGPDTAKLVYLSCYARDGRRLAGGVLRQMRTAPIGFGSASMVEPVNDPEADSLSDAFLRGVGYAGICELELKRDTRDGAVKLIEANPRFSVTADAATGMGLDIGWLHYLDIIGQRVEPVAPNGRAFRHIVLSRDAACVRSYLQAGLLTWGGLLRSYRPPTEFFDVDFHDWRNTRSTLVNALKTILYPYYRRLVPKR